MSRTRGRAGGVAFDLSTDQCNHRVGSSDERRLTQYTSHYNTSQCQRRRRRRHDTTHKAVSWGFTWNRSRRLAGWITLANPAAATAAFNSSQSRPAIQHTGASRHHTNVIGTTYRPARYLCDHILKYYTQVGQHALMRAGYRFMSSRA